MTGNSELATVDAVFAGGVFRPLGDVSTTENQRVRLTIQPMNTPAQSDWLTEVTDFQRQVTDRHGTLPDCAPQIAADRQRDE